MIWVNDQCGRQSESTYSYFSWGRESNNEMEKKSEDTTQEKFPSPKEILNSGFKCQEMFTQNSQNRYDTYPSKLTDFKIEKKFFGHYKMKKLSPAYTFPQNYLEQK